MSFQYLLSATYHSSLVTKNMSDTLVRAIGAYANIRCLAAITTRLVEEARRRQGTYPTATVALGRALTGGILLGGLLKGDERLNLQINGRGPLGSIVADANAYGHVRGFVRYPHVQLPLRDGNISIKEAIGAGTLQILRIQENQKEPYRGIVPLVSGEIAKDLTSYLVNSEQIPSAVALGVYIERDNRVTAAGGFIVQALPGAKDKDLSLVERNISTLPPCSEMILNGMGPRDIITRVMEGISIKFLEEKEVSYRCRCSKERVVRVMIALGPEEIHDILAKEGEVKASCEFCKENYVITREELQQLLVNISHTAPESSSQKLCVRDFS
jgi:molecular chaperone Hsp33